MSIFKGDSSRIGLDIGTTGLRMVQVRADGAKPKLETFGALSLDAHVTQSDSPADRQQLVAAIKKLLSNSKASSRDVVLGFPSSKVFASLINLPKMSSAELAKSIPFQAEQYVPMPIDEVKYDWLVANDNLPNNQMEVLLVGAPNTLAEHYLKIVEDSGLNAIAFEPDAFGLARSVLSNVSSAAVALNVGANSTDLVTVYKDIPRLIRSIPVGGETLVKMVAQNLDLEPPQASQFVYKFGLAQGKMEGQIFRAVKGNVDTLVSEVDKSNKFFMNRYKEAKIEKIILTGGSSGVPELPAFLANTTGLPVEIGNSWVNINYRPELGEQLLQVSNLFSVAAGLAIRGIV